MLLDQTNPRAAMPLVLDEPLMFQATPENGKMAAAQGCTAISSVDPQIAAYHKAAG